MKRLAICGWFLGVEGGLLLAVAGIHLLVIPVLRRGLAQELTPRDMASLWAPFLLNHVVVGLLLIPLGISTIYAGMHLRRRERWAHNIALLNAGTVMCLPVVLFATLPRHYFHAMPLLLASSLVCVAAASMMWPLLWAAREFREGAGSDGSE